MVPDRRDFDPLEQMIYDIFKADVILNNVFGPWFDWNIEPQGVPYCLCVPMGGSPNIYTIPSEDQPRDVITQPCRQFSVFSTKRELLTDETNGVLQAISLRMEAIANIPMKGGSTCLSSLMPFPWDVSYESQKNKFLNANVWHGMARFNFIVQRPPGRL